MQTKFVLTKTIFAKIVCTNIAGLLALAIAAGPAAAQSAGANRTFVSGRGVDTSTCVAPSQPCRTFAYALARTVPGGAVIAQNAAEYGPVSITQSVSLIGPNGGGAMVTGGVNVDAGSSGTVILRGLEVVGGGDISINIASFGSFALTDSIVRGASYGIQTFAGGNVTITNSTIADYGDTGVYLGGGDNLVMTGSTVIGAANLGVSVSGGSRIVDCTIFNAGGTGLSFVGNAFVKGTLLTGNNIGVALASNTTLSLDTTTIAGNGTGISAINSGATINSYGNNNIAGNGVQVSGTPITKVSAN